MKKFQQSDRDFHRRFPRIGQVRPKPFLVRLDRRFILSEGTVSARVRIHMAVRHVMRRLANRPATGTIRCIELPPGEAVHRVVHVFGRCRDLCNGLRAFGRSERGFDFCTFRLGSSGQWYSCSLNIVGRPANTSAHFAHRECPDVPRQTNAYGSRGFSVAQNAVTLLLPASLARERMRRV